MRKGLIMRKNDSKLLRPLILAFRYTTVSIVSCALLSLLAVLTVLLIQYPERLIQMNFSASETTLEQGALIQNDSNWDGVMMGIGIGWVAGGFDPVLCSPVAALLGGIMGHQLDNKQ